MLSYGILGSHNANKQRGNHVRACIACTSHFVDKMRQWYKTTFQPTIPSYMYVVLKANHLCGSAFRNFHRLESGSACAGTGWDYSRFWDWYKPFELSCHCEINTDSVCSKHNSDMQQITFLSRHSLPTCPSEFTSSFPDTWQPWALQKNIGFKKNS